MRNNNPITIDKIRNRSIALNSSKDNSDNQYLYEISLASIKQNRSTIKSDVSKFMSGCMNYKNANKHYRHCLNLLEKMQYDKEISSIIESDFINFIIPYIERPEQVQEVLTRYNLSESSLDKINDSLKEYKVCDRIINNDKTLSKRFDFDKYIKENAHRPFDDIILHCCSMMDTYNTKSYAKMNIALEELSYVLQKNSIGYDRKKFVQLVTEYFLHRQEVTAASDMKKYRTVLSENRCITDEDLSNVKYFTESDIDENEVKRLLNDFKSGDDKSISKLKDTIESIFSKNIFDIISELPNILIWVREFLTLGIIDKKYIVEIIEFITDKFINMELKRDEITKIILTFETEVNNTEVSMDINDGDKYEKLLSYNNALNSSLDKLNDFKSDLYTDISIQDTISFEEFGRLNGEVMSLNEFKIFKFQNLIRAAREIDKFLQRKGNKFVNTISDKAKKVFKSTKKWFAESYNNNDFDLDSVYDCITDNNNFDMVIATYKSDDISNMHDIMTGLVQSINDECINQESSRVYYVNMGNLFEIHLEDYTYISLTDEEEDKKQISENNLYYCASIIQLSEEVEKLVDMDLDNTIPTMLSKANELDAERLSNFITASSLTGDIISYNDVKDLVDNYNINNPDDYTGNTLLNCALESWTAQTVSNDIIISALETSNEILNEAIDLNAVKLGIEGLKDKVKQLGTKEQEMSRDLDATVNHFIRSMENTVKNDRREAIIKGSLIPSFSKCLKSAITFAGLGLITGNWVIPIITAFASLAVSKNLNKKERSLLLDEIDIELKALEKEINMAENANQMKKYRKLLTYQKKLQRERQRIKYNLKGWKDLPDTND